MSRRLGNPETREQPGRSADQGEEALTRPQPGPALEVCLYFPNNVETLFPNNDTCSSNDSALPMLNPSCPFLKAFE